MSSNEEYLDNLLKSMGNDEKEEPMDEKSVSVMSSDEIEAMFAAAEQAAMGEVSQNQETEAEQDAMTEPETEAEPESDVMAELEAEPESDTVAEPEAEPETDVTEGSDSDDQIMTQEEIEKLLAEADQPEELPPVETEEAGPTVESTQSMTQEEIEKLLAATEQPEEEQPAAEAEEGPTEISDNEDILSLLGSLSENDDLSEINDLLQKSDANVQVADDSQSETGDFSEMLPEELPEELREEQPEEKKEKKKGFFAKLFSALTEENESEDTLSDENQTIMQELEAEDQAEAKKKKKLKKGKMPANGGAEEGQEEEGATAGKGKKEKKKKEKKEKPKKEPKPKKQKAPKVIEQEDKPAKRISKKSIGVIVLFAVTVFVIVFFGMNFFSGMIRKKSAEKAFERQDYLTCYETLYGMELSEDEEEMFRHAEIVLRMQRRLSVYENNMKNDRELEALDSLMQAVAGYEELYGRAQEYGAGAEVMALYKQVLRILEESYGLTQEDARSIALCKSNVEYTRYLTALVEGQRVSSEGNGEGIVLPEEEMEDILPAETEMEQPEFIEREE